MPGTSGERAPPHRRWLPRVRFKPGDAKFEIRNILEVGEVFNATPSRQNPPTDGEDGSGEVTGEEVVGDDADAAGQLF